MSSRPADEPTHGTPRTSAIIKAGSADLSGISELFGLERDGASAATRTNAGTAGGWVSATEGTVYGSNDPSGRLVHGRYRLIAELGAGGMGVTYRAWDTQAGLPVVVKMPKREVRHDREVMARFTREIAAMQAVPHESIVPITDSGEDEGCPFVVMRFLPGGSLADYRRRDDAGKPIKNPSGMLFYWLPGVAAALDRIHARRMLHRDVKPGNIFLDGFLKPYLGDFGIAKVVDDSGGLEKEQTLTATKMAVGTPEYMAPELFKPKAQPDGRVDQYALAVTVYEMLAGEKPFTGSTAHIVVEHSSLPVPPLEKKCPGLRPSVYAAVHRALAKNPEERFTTCEEFAAAVLGEIKPLEPEVDTVRLLCPNCRNILKLPQKSAGRKGKCPRCQSVMDVAEDLGSLWLDGEESATRRESKGWDKPSAASSGPSMRFDVAVDRRVRFGRFLLFSIATIPSFFFLLIAVSFIFVDQDGRIPARYFEASMAGGLFLTGFLWVVGYSALYELPLLQLREIGKHSLKSFPHFSWNTHWSACVPFEVIDHVEFMQHNVMSGNGVTVIRVVIKNGEPMRNDRWGVWLAPIPPAALRPLLEARGITVLDEANAPRA